MVGVKRESYWWYSTHDIRPYCSSEAGFNKPQFPITIRLQVNILIFACLYVCRGREEKEINQSNYIENWSLWHKVSVNLTEQEKEMPNTHVAGVWREQTEWLNYLNVVEQLDVVLLFLPTQPGCNMFMFPSDIICVATPNTLATNFPCL